MKKIQWLSLILLLVALRTRAGTLYFVTSGCGATANIQVYSTTYGLWRVGSPGSPVAAPTSWAMNVETVTLYGTGVTYAGFAAGGTNDYTWNVCSGGAPTVGAPASYSGPMKLCYDIINDSTVARTYSTAEYIPSTGTWEVDPNVQVLGPGMAQSGTLTVTAAANRSHQVFGRYEAGSDGVKRFTRLGGVVSNSVAWVASVSNCVTQSFYDKGGLAAGQNTEASDAAAYGITNMVQRPVTNKMDTLSQTNSRIAYAAPTGGALVASDFKTGISSLKTGLDDISKQLEDLRKGQTNSQGSAPDLGVTSGTINSAAATALSGAGVTAPEAAFATRMGGLGGTSQGSAYGTRTADVWGVTVLGETWDLNPMTRLPAMSGAADWSRWVIGWGMTVGLLFHIWNYANHKMTFIGPTQSMKSHLTGVWAAAGVVVSGLMATAVVVAMVALPLLFWTIIATSSDFTELASNPLTKAATGGSGIWIARATDFALRFIPLDIALGHLIHYVVWRASFDTLAMAAFAITKFCVG